MSENTTKIEFRWFTVFRYEEEGAYLSRRHSQGWEFSRVEFPGIYHFQKCEPEEVRYQLDYNQEGLAHQTEYQQMFADCGWEHVTDFMGYSYFRKKKAEMGTPDEEIFCDDESRLEMVKRIFRGRMLQLLVIFFCVIIPQLVMQFQGKEPVVFSAFLALFVLYLVIFLQFSFQYRKWKKRIRK